jgi:hypothetical protein
VSLVGQIFAPVTDSPINNNCQLLLINLRPCDVLPTRRLPTPAYLNPSLSDRIRTS